MTKNKNIDNMDPHADGGYGLPLFSGGESRDEQAKKMGRFVEEFKANFLALDDIPIDLEKGGICPCCGKFARSYKRIINKGMTKILYWLYFQSKDGLWVDFPAKAPRNLMRNNEISRLALWGFVESKENDDYAKKDSGIWRITKKGRNFIFGGIKVPKYYEVYNNKIFNASVKEVYFQDCVDIDFDYRTLMENK